MRFQVDQIDHAELTVPDRFAAAQWYRSVLGLEILDEFRFWSDDANGPLMIGTLRANTKLALFQGEPIPSQRDVGFHLLAFCVSGQMFLLFLDQLPSLQLRDKNGKVLSRQDVRDHQRALSIYFRDPWGHDLELTTYDHELVRQAIARP